VWEVAGLPSSNGEEVARPRAVLRRGQGKDGDPDFSSYVAQHPTNYIWREKIEALTDRLVNTDPFSKHIWVDAYKKRPPGFP
jgi:hypothetical protein